MICGTMSVAIASAHARLTRSNDSSCRSLRWAGLEKWAASATSDCSLRRAFLASSFSAAIRSSVAKTCGSMVSSSCSLSGLRPEAADREDSLLAVGRERPPLLDLAPGVGLGRRAAGEVPGADAGLAGRPRAGGVEADEVARRPEARDNERQVEHAGVVGVDVLAVGDLQVLDLRRAERLRVAGV